MLQPFHPLLLLFLLLPTVKRGSLNISQISPRHCNLQLHFQWFAVCLCPFCPQTAISFCILYFVFLFPSAFPPTERFAFVCLCLCVLTSVLTFNKLSKVSPVFCARKSPGYCSLCSLQIWVFLVSFSSSSFCCYMLFSSWLLRPSVCRLFLCLTDCCCCCL